MKHSRRIFLTLTSITLATVLSASAADPHIGVDAKPVPGAELLMDGSRALLDAKWTYWTGRASSPACPSNGKLWTTQWTRAR